MVHAEERFDRELGFCQTISTPMPDPRAPSFYTALPTGTGKKIAGAGWSGHVKAWFNFMRDPVGGAVPQYLAYEKQLGRTAQEYRQAVIEQGSKLLKETEKSSFKKSVQDLNTSKNSQVVILVDEYGNEDKEVKEGYKALGRAVGEVEVAKKDLVAVQREYDAFLSEMKKKDLEQEKQLLLDESESVFKALSVLIGSLSTSAAAIPFDATSIVKVIGGDPITSIVKLAVRPDPAKLAALDAQLEELETKIKEHKDKAFRAKIASARVRLENNLSLSQSSAERILLHKQKSFQKIHALAGLEKEGHGFQFFHSLLDYYKSVAKKAASLNEAVNGYYKFLTATRLDEGEILLKHIEVDIDHVRRHNLDPGGEWMRLAVQSESWLKTHYLPWYQPEVQGVGKCLTGFKELRHLGLVDKSVNMVIEATNGIPDRELGNYFW
jgi:hypothetical protein